MRFLDYATIHAYYYNNVMIFIVVQKHTAITALIIYSNETSRASIIWQSVRDDSGSSGSGSRDATLALVI